MANHWQAACSINCKRCGPGDLLSLTGVCLWSGTSGGVTVATLLGSAGQAGSFDLDQECWTLQLHGPNCQGLTRVTYTAMPADEHTLIDKQRGHAMPHSRLLCGWAATVPILTCKSRPGSNHYHRDRN